MKIEIRIGDTSTNNRIKYNTFDKSDDIKIEKQRMYDFLINSKDCIIEDVDNFLLYTLTSGILAYIVKDNNNKELKTDKEYNLIPHFNPEIYKVFEITQDGSENPILDSETSLIKKNYFNDLMCCIMDDYYLSLYYY